MCQWMFVCYLNFTSCDENNNFLNSLYFHQSHGIVTHKSCLQCPQNRRKQNRTLHNLRESKINQQRSIKEVMTLRVLFFFKLKRWYHLHENKFRCSKTRKFECCIAMYWKKPTIKKMWEYVAGMEFNLLSTFNRDII